jgi:hypothetical protein
MRGRTKGSPNKRTSEFKQILDKIRFNIPVEAAKLYPTLGPSMKFKMLEYLSQYCYPKLFAKVLEDDETPEAMAESTEELLALADGIRNPIQEEKGKSTDADTARRPE